ncbi:MAG: epoxyqueuosine reductase QueH [Lachnospiraceae bacterium]|nr:epoxyqueuosine reductase QueH [Lachnospiraceae bacterium]
MDNKCNFQLKLDQILQNIEHRTKEGGYVPTLLLHSCCAPCSSYVLEYLSNYLSITIFYYNPNISALEEYQKRVEEQKRLIKELPVRNPVSFIEGRHDNDEFLTAIKGLEHLGERSARCYACYRLRLEETAKVAKEQGFDYFTTTLSISPYKNAQWINELGEMLQQEYGVDYLYADFKKKNGYKRSIELSEQYHLYRQDYCGCVYSRIEEEERRKKAVSGGC